MKKTPSRSFTLGVLIWLLGASLAACQTAPIRTTTDLELLQGHWEGRGPGGACSVSIQGNSLVYNQPATDDSKPQFWYETPFTLPGDTDPKQLHATILKHSWPVETDIGRVVVTIFKIEDGKLTLGVVEDFEGPPTDPVVGDWDWVMDIYYLERARV